MKKILIGFSLFGVVLIGTGLAKKSINTKILETPTLTITDFMTGLDKPWDLAFTPEKAMLYTERCVGLSVRRTDGTITRLFGKTDSAVAAPDLFCEGQSGMNGVAVDPEFTSNRLIYVFMSSNLSTGPRTNRVVRLKVDATYTTVTERTDIITDIAFKDVGNTWGDSGAHSGGRLRFGPDRFLYVTTGDNHNGPLPQDRRKLGGKILRVDRNGDPAPDNLNPAEADARIFTYGHRNPQGLTFRPTTGRPIIAEHGPNHSDEVTALTAGGNGGWDPVPEEGVVCADNYCGYISNKRSGALTPMTDLDKFPNAMKPLFVLSDSQGMGPASFVTGAQWKGWDGAMLVGIMAAQKLYILHLGDNDELTSMEIAQIPEDRIRSLVQGADGELFIMTDSGKIWKAVPN
jgi:glucose/arabinose dehydrogenase